MGCFICGKAEEKYSMFGMGGRICENCHTSILDLRQNCNCSTQENKNRYWNAYNYLSQFTSTSPCVVNELQTYRASQQDTTGAGNNSANSSQQTAAPQNGNPQVVYQQTGNPQGVNQSYGYKQNTYQQNTYQQSGYPQAIRDANSSQNSSLRQIASDVRTIKNIIIFVLIVIALYLVIMGYNIVNIISELQKLAHLY